MHMKIINTSLHTDQKNGTWFFMAHGNDGSIYSYNTFDRTSKTDEKTMFSKLTNLVQDGLINTDYWRLV